jgi:hypothetical protein
MAAFKTVPLGTPPNPGESAARRGAHRRPLRGHAERRRDSGGPANVPALRLDHSHAPMIGRMDDLELLDDPSGVRIVVLHGEHDIASVGALVLPSQVREKPTERWSWNCRSWRSSTRRSWA